LEGKAKTSVNPCATVGCVADAKLPALLDGVGAANLDFSQAPKLELPSN